MTAVTPPPASGPAFRLVRRPGAATAPPVLDAAQRAVVAHSGGPLLVLAGPGTGKTTTLVESVVARIEGGVDPERILVLTFSRKAAGELRERITGRLARTVREPLARTFHSYAFGVLRREAALRGDPPPRLLSGPEQDLVIRELLRGEVAGVGAPSGWPADLRPALLTRGFAQELRDLLLRCRERGLDAVALDELGVLHGRADWRAAARFYDQYAAVSALAEPAAYDPSELVRAVVDGGLADAERGAYDWVFVDEYQDTDPSQEELLRHLVPLGGSLVVVGDPNQSIYGFRGADVSCIRRFREVFPHLDGTPAREVRLVTNRRSGQRLVSTARSVADRLRGPHTHRDVVALPDRPPGRVDVLVAASASQEATLVAGALRRAHVVDGIPWSRMAVVVRSTRGRLAVLRRAMLSAGVPVAVAGDEVPLADQPGLRPLLDVFRVALSPEALDEGLAVELLTGPLGGADPLGLRRLRRELRRMELAGGGRRPSSELVVEAILDPRVLETVAEHVAAPAKGLANLIRRVREAHEEPDSTVETLLWEVWQGSGLAPRLQAASLAGGSRAAAADRDLDAVMALFEAAARFVDRLPMAGPAMFLDHLIGQEIPGDTLAATAPEGEVVRVLTAHAAKGLEWDHVVVAGVQEGAWPDLRVRGSLLGSSLLVDVVAAVGEASGPTLPELLDEERRLFYVAVTRARERLLVTAVSDTDAGDEPSRFIGDLPIPADSGAQVLGHGPSGIRTPADDSDLAALRRTTPLPSLLPQLRQIAADDRQPPRTRSRARELLAELRSMTRSLDLTALVAELRAVVTDGSAGDVLRETAAAQLARLAAAGVPGASPDDWWGALHLSDDRPLREPDETVTVSPSKVEQFSTCELRWLLESVGGGSTPTASQSVGTLVHAVAAATREMETVDEASVLAELDRRWADVDLGSAWYTLQMRDRAAAMVRRFLAWRATTGRRLVDVEVSFSAEVPPPEERGAGMPEDVRGRAAVIKGQVDRLEVDAEGGAFVVDLKTGSSKPGDAEVAEHPQLGVYQLAVEAGAFAEHGLRAAAGASLVQVGKAAGVSFKEQRQPALRAAEDPRWAARLVADVATGMAGSAFVARENDYCQMCPVRSSCPLQDEGAQVVTP